MRFQKATIVIPLALCFATLAACGGGGGGGSSNTPGTLQSPTGPSGTPSRNNGVSMGLDVSELSFAAANASAPTPREQQVEVYFDNFAGRLTGDVFLQVTLSGAAVGSGTNTTRLTFQADGKVSSSDGGVGGIGVTIPFGVGGVNGGAGGITIDTSGGGILITGNNVNSSSPGSIMSSSEGSVSTVLEIPAVAPSVLGAGKFTGTATVRACLGDSSCASGELPGSPRTINISYVVDPISSGTVDAPTNAVVPRIQIANTPGNVVIRGQSLEAVTNVRFGNTDATAVSVVSATEVRAKVPALPAGTYAVTLNNGAVPFNGSVQVVAPITATAQVLAYPGITPSRVTAVVYDDANQTLLVVLAADAPANNQVVRYARTAMGDWTSAVFSVPNLNDLVLTNEGSRLLAVTDRMVMELSLDTLTATRTVPAPASLGAGVRLQRLALGNDGRAVITTNNGRYLSPTLLYSTTNGSFVSLNNAGQLERSALVSTDDGAHIFVTRSVLAGSVLDYDSSSSVVGMRSASVRHATDQPLAVDQNVTRVITYNSLPSSGQILGADFSPLATLDDDEPGVFTTDAAVIDRAGTRAVALQDRRFFFFDLTSGAVNGRPLGTPLSLAFSGGPIQTAVTADGQVAFFANTTGVAVVPIAR